MSKNKKKGGGAPAPQQPQQLSQAEKLKVPNPKLNRFVLTDCIESW